MSREITKKIRLWVLVFALFAAHVFFRSVAHAEEGDSWKEVQARSGDCRISFPALPQMIEQSFKVNEAGMRLSYDVYLAPYLDRGVCLLLVAQYPAPLAKGHETAGLEGLLRGIIGQHPENQLVFAELLDMSGSPALTFLVQSGKNYFRGFAVMVGSKLYLIAMEGRKQHFEEAVFQKFFKSFQLIQAQS